jgi:uncharacterized protein YgbK (DUF1537 family)
MQIIPAADKRLLYWLMIVVLADDLSGATELAGIAFARGLSAEVQTRFEPSCDAQVLALDTDTRSASVDEAVATVRKLTREVLAAGPEWIYKKTDSVLRGHVRAEVTAVLEESAQTRALLIPANPGRERIVRGGQYFVHDTPLDRTVFATDPEYPARSANVHELMHRSPGAAVTLLNGDHASLPARGIIIPDVSTASDLVRYAGAATDKTLCCGAAEFFDAILARRTETPPAAATSAEELPTINRRLFICGSAAAWPSRRDQCVACSLPALTVPANLFVERDERHRMQALLQLRDAVLECVWRHGTAVLAIGEPNVAEALTPATMVALLAEATSIILQARTIDQVLIEGGATAIAVVRRMGWNRLRVRGQFAGLSIHEVLGRQAPWVTVKPGSYPWPDSIWLGGKKSLAGP